MMSEEAAASGGKWNRYQKAYISPVNHARVHQLRIREESSFEGNSRAQPGSPRLHRLGGLKFRQRFPPSGINFGERSREMRRTTTMARWSTARSRCCYPGSDAVLGSPGLRHKYATGLPSRHHRYRAILRLEENHLPLRLPRR